MEELSGVLIIIAEIFWFALSPEVCLVCPPSPTLGPLPLSPTGTPLEPPPTPHGRLAGRCRSQTLTAALPLRGAERAPVQTADTSKDDALFSSKLQVLQCTPWIFISFLSHFSPHRVLPDVPLPGLRASPITVRQEPPRRVNSPVRVPPPGQNPDTYVGKTKTIQLPCAVQHPGLCLTPLWQYLLWIFAEQVSAVK